MEKGQGKGTDTLQTDKVFTRKEYIEREAAIKAVAENDCEGYATWAIKAIPAADVVARDCFDKILAENDDMRAIIDAAMKRLCEWCGVGCSMENRRAELCEIASVGLEFLAEEGE